MTRRAPDFFPRQAVHSLRWCTDGRGFSPLTPAHNDVLQRLREKPEDGAAWNDLAVLLDPGMIIPGLNGGSLTRDECFRNAAHHAWDNAAVWSNIGASLAPGETIDVRDTSMSAIGCHLRAVRLDPASGPNWLNLALCMGAEQTFPLLEGRIGRLEALAQAVECFEKDASGGGGDGVDHTGNTDMDAPTMLSGCYAMAAAAMMAGHSAAVFGDVPPRARAFPVPPGSVPRTPLRCLQRAVEVAGPAPHILNMAGSLMRSSDILTVETEEGERSDLHRRDVLQRLTEFDSDNSDRWADLATEVPAGTTISVAGGDYTHEQLLLRAVRMNVTCVPAWRLLAEYCTTHDQIVNLTNAKGAVLTFSAVDCFGRALLYEPRDPSVWEAAAAAVEKATSATITIGTTKATSQDCRAMAAALRDDGPVPAALVAILGSATAAAAA
jgi:hypothetical protein